MKKTSVYMFSLLLSITSAQTYCSSSSMASNDVKVSQETLLEYAKRVETDSPERVVELLKKGASINAKDPLGKTALHYFAQKGFDSCVHTLVREKKIDLDAVDNRLWTPLHYAAAGSHLAIVRQLVNKRAQCDAATNEGKIPLELVPEYETLPDEILEATEDAIQEIDPDFSQPAQCLFLLFRGLVDTRSKNSKVARGRVMLHYAVELLNPEFVKIILQPDPPMSASFSNAPENRDFIHRAAMASSTKLYYSLKDEDEMTPLHLLAKKFPQEVAFAILNHGQNNVRFPNLRSKLVYRRFKILLAKSSLSANKLIADLREKVPSLAL